MSLAKCTTGVFNEFPELSTKSIEVYTKSGRLKIKAHIIMKEFFNMTGTWFTRGNYRNTLLFKVALCSTQGAIKKYQRESLYVNQNQLITINDKSKQEVLIDVGAEMLARGISPTKKDLKKYFYKTQDSIKYYQIPFFVEFELENIPPFLELLLIPKILSDESSASTGINMYIKRDIIFKEGKVPSSTTALISNGVVWTGPTRQVGNFLRGGPTVPRGFQTTPLQQMGYPTLRLKILGGGTRF